MWMINTGLNEVFYHRTVLFTSFWVNVEVWRDRINNVVRDVSIGADVAASGIHSADTSADRCRFTHWQRIYRPLKLRRIVIDINHWDHHSCHRRQRRSTLTHRQTYTPTVTQTNLKTYISTSHRQWDQISAFVMFASHNNFRHFISAQFLSASLYVSKRGAYWDRLCRDVVGWLVGRWLVGRWLSRACTVAKRCILGL